MDAARDIGKGLVDGNPFDEGREVTQYRDGGVAQPLVLLEMAADKSEVRTELTRPPSRHPAADAEGLGFVRSGKNNPATNRDRPAAQRRIEQLLDRSVEGVQVRMEDSGYRFHPDSLFARCLKWTALIETSEHKENNQPRLSSHARLHRLGGKTKVGPRSAQAPTPLKRQSAGRVRSLALSRRSLQCAVGNA